MNTLVAEGSLKSINPATLEPVGEVQVTVDVAPVVAAAAAAQESWRESSFADRRVSPAQAG